MSEDAANEAPVPTPAVDRRQHARKGAAVNRLLRATVEWEDGKPEECYLYLVDISERGMRVNVDRCFPEDHPVRLRFSLVDLQFEAQVHPIWQKFLTGGTWTVGLEVRDENVAATDVMRSIMEVFSAGGRRIRFRLRQVLTVTMQRASDERWYSVTTLDISPGGLKVRWDEPLEEGEIVHVKIFPEDLPDVEAHAQVMWQRDIGPERFEFGLKFTDITEAGATSIQRYIDRSVGAA